MKITAEGLGKRFSRDWIFKDLTLTFSSPNQYAILGPNGSGKSTLLQVLWGQVPASMGNIRYSDDAKTIPIENIYQHLSIVAPYMDLIEEFTLTEMIHFHFKFKKMIIGQTIDQAIEAMGLSHAANKRIATFSSGMRQRLKLGLAFSTQSDILFFDEPCTNLDRTAIEWYQSKLSQLQPSTLLIIASNQEYEYPEKALKINILDYKQGYYRADRVIKPQ